MRRLLSRLLRPVVQPIPPELEACEFCGRRECLDAEWRVCEKRLATADFVRTRDAAALERLKRAHEEDRPPAAPKTPS